MSGLSCGYSAWRACLLHLQRQAQLFPCVFRKLKAIPHNSKCRYGERGAADAKPKAQIILDAAKVSAASGGNSEPKQGQRSQSARGFCPRSTMRVPQPDIIEHFGNADAVPQLPERCLSRKAGIVRCCPKKKNRKGNSLFTSRDAGKEHRMQHNKNSDANVEIRCEAQATKRGGGKNVTGKARELDIGKEKRFEKMWNKMQENP